MGGPKVYLEHGGEETSPCQGSVFTHSVSIIPVFLNTVVVFSFSVDEISYGLLFCWATYVGGLKSSLPRP